MFTIYVYVLDTLADWELEYVTSELNLGRFFRKNSQRVLVKTEFAIKLWKLIGRYNYAEKSISCRWYSKWHYKKLQRN